jgi:small subunit ribosomal protein S14
MASIRWKVKQKLEPKFKTRKYNRCSICGRRRAYYRKFKVCRLCIRMLANRAEVPGLRKASW